MKREFKEESFKLLVKLEQEGKIPQNTVLGKSVLDSAQGERVWNLLKVLCDSALKSEIIGISIPYYQNLQTYIQNPASAIRSSVLRMKKSMTLHIKIFAEKFNKNAQILAGKQVIWAEHAKFLTLEHKNLRNLYDSLATKKKKIDPNTHIIEKLAALDRVPQIDMLRYIWKNIDNVIQSTKARNGEFLISQIIDSPTINRKIQGNIQSNLISWGKELENISSKLENESHPNGIQYFASQLKEISLKYKQEQKEQLDALKSHRDFLKNEYTRLKLSIESNT